MNQQQDAAEMEAEAIAHISTLQSDISKGIKNRKHEAVTGMVIDWIRAYHKLMVSQDYDHQSKIDNFVRFCGIFSIYGTEFFHAHEEYFSREDYVEVVQKISGMTLFFSGSYESAKRHKERREIIETDDERKTTEIEAEFVRLLRRFRHLLISRAEEGDFFPLKINNEVKELSNRFLRETFDYYDGVENRNKATRARVILKRLGKLLDFEGTRFSRQTFVIYDLEKILKVSDIADKALYEEYFLSFVKKIVYYDGSFNKEGRPTALQYLSEEDKLQSNSGNVLSVIFDRADEIAATTLKGRPAAGTDHPSRSAVRARIDDDVIDWLKDKNPQYTTQINAYLKALKEAEEAIQTPAAE